MPNITNDLDINIFKDFKDAIDAIRMMGNFRENILYEQVDQVDQNAQIQTPQFIDYGGVIEDFAYCNLNTTVEAAEISTELIEAAEISTELIEAAKKAVSCSKNDNTKKKKYKGNKEVVNKQDTKNKFIIYNFVKNKFSLEKESLKLFKYRLFFEPHIAKEYKNVLGNSKDLRKRFKIENSDLKYIDQGWVKFSNTFHKFIDYYENKTHQNFSYTDFRNNKIKIDGQEFKFKKAIADFYSKNLNYFFIDFSHMFDENSEIKFCSKLFNEIAPKNIIDYVERELNRRIFIKFNCGYSNGCIHFVSGYTNFLYGTHVRFIKSTKNLTKIIGEVILRPLQEIGKSKIPNGNKLELVLSLNFADWFLCSTGENWSSCLNLESDFSEARWAGLPGLIGDKNRALLYITDGRKKNYNGIEVDRILSRSWISIARRIRPSKYKKLDKEYKKTKFIFVNEYPNQFKLNKIATNYLDFDFIEDNFLMKKYVGKYYIELIRHEEKEGREHLCYIFLDKSRLNIAKKNKAKYFSNKFGYLTFGYRGYHYLNYIIGEYKILDNSSFCFRDGFNYLLGYKNSIIDYFKIYE